MNQATAERMLTCACGIGRCPTCIKVAAFEEAAQIAESAAIEYGAMCREVCRVVARKIRAEMALIQEHA